MTENDYAELLGKVAEIVADIEQQVEVDGRIDREVQILRTTDALSALIGDDSVPHVKWMAADALAREHVGRRRSRQKPKFDLTQGVLFDVDDDAVFTIGDNEDVRIAKANREDVVKQRKIKGDKFEQHRRRYETEDAIYVGLLDRLEHDGQTIGEIDTTGLIDWHVDDEVDVRSQGWSYDDPRWDDMAH